MKKNRRGAAESRTWSGEIKSLPMKYHKRALVPCQLTRNAESGQQYVTTDGVRVCLSYIGTYDNSHGLGAKKLEKESQKLYNMSFAAIEAVWRHRIGVLDGWWDIVNLTDVNATEGK